MGRRAGAATVGLALACAIAPAAAGAAPDAPKPNKPLRVTEVVSRVTHGTKAVGGASPSMSSDGMRILFSSDAALVPSDGNGVSDIYLRDRASATTTLVSATPAGATGEGYTNIGAISPNGRWATFASEAQGIAPELSTFALDQFAAAPRVYLRDLHAGTTQLVKSCVAGEACIPATPDPLNLNTFVSDDGDVLYTEKDPVDQEAGRAAVWDRGTGRTQIVAPLAAGHTYPWGISADGDRLIFESSDESLAPGANGWTIYVYDRAAAELTAVPDGGEQWPDELVGFLSADGSTVAFNRFPSELGTVNATVHAVDLATGEEREVLAHDGAPLDATSFLMGVSATGRFITFASYATNAVLGDTNSRGDLFLADTLFGTVERVSVARDGSELPEFSNGGPVSADGQSVLFQTIAENVVPKSFPDGVNVYLRRR